MAEQNVSKEIARQFEAESDRARQLVTEKPKHWQCFLAIELLRSKLSPTRKRFEELHKGRGFKRSSQVGEKEVIGWLVCKVEDLRNLIPHLQSVICNDLIPSVNATAKDDNPGSILAAVEDIRDGARQLLLWEEEMRFTLLPSRIEPIQKTLHGTTVQAFDELNALADKIEAPLKKKNPGGKHTIKIAFKDPPNMRKLSKQLSELLKDVEQNPRNWIGWS